MRTLSTEFYVDESKARGYIIVAAVVPSGQATHLRKALRDLRMKGQRRIHFVEESPGVEGNSYPQWSLWIARPVSIGFETLPNWLRAEPACGR